MAEKINAFTKAGGKLLVTGKSGLIDGKFALDAIPAEYAAPSEYDIRYMRFGEGGIFSDIPKIDHVLYKKGETVTAAAGAEVLAKIVPPYFNRTHETFCSHGQTPPVHEVSGEPAVITGDNCIYISSPLFADYAENGYSVYKEILIACIKRLYGRLPIEADVPNLSEILVREAENGLVVHTLSYAIIRRCKMDTIDDEIELYEKAYSIRAGFKPSSVRIVPEGKEIGFEYADGYVNYTLPYQKGHSMVLIGK
jgi:hypothetical protein